MAEGNTGLAVALGLAAGAFLFFALISFGISRYFKSKREKEEAGPEYTMAPAAAPGPAPSAAPSTSTYTLEPTEVSWAFNPDGFNKD